MARHDAGVSVVGSAIVRPPPRTPSLRESGGLYGGTHPSKPSSTRLFPLYQWRLRAGRATPKNHIPRAQAMPAALDASQRATEGRWVNAETDDDDVFITLLYYHIPVAQ